MTTRAKVLCTVSTNDDPVDVFNVVRIIESEIKEMVREAVSKVEKGGQRLPKTMKEQGMKWPETVIHSSDSGMQALTVSFSLGSGQDRSLLVLLNPGDIPVRAGRGTVLLSLGMNGRYREILLSCGKALSGDRELLYTDDLCDGYFTAISPHDQVTTQATVGI